MRVATFNINDVNKRLDNLIDWLAETEPDIVCLQELKAAQDEFPDDIFDAMGYSTVWLGQRSWNGVAIQARGFAPVVTQRLLPGDPDKKQSRYIEAAINGVVVGCLYLPNGNPQPGPKFEYKLDWFERLIDHAAGLYASGLPVILAGDFNVVPEPRDIYATNSYNDNALVQPAPRAAFQRLLAQGWTDAIRAIHPDETVYTFWDYMRNRWGRDGGLRIDHLLLSEPLSARLVDAGVDKEFRGRDGASDHAPVWIELDD